MIPHIDRISSEPNRYAVTDLGGGKSKIIRDDVPIVEGTDVNKRMLDEMLAFSGEVEGDGLTLTLQQDGYTPFDGAPGRIKLNVDIQYGATLQINDWPVYPIVDTGNRPLRPGHVAGTYLSLVFNGSAYVLTGGGWGFPDRWDNMVTGTVGEGTIRANDAVVVQTKLYYDISISFISDVGINPKKVSSLTGIGLSDDDELFYYFFTASNADLYGNTYGTNSSYAVSVYKRISAGKYISIGTYLIPDGTGSLISKVNKNADGVYFITRPDNGTVFPLWKLTDGACSSLTTWILNGTIQSVNPCIPGTFPNDEYLAINMNEGTAGIKIFANENFGSYKIATTIPVTGAFCIKISKNKFFLSASFNTSTTTFKAYNISKLPYTPTEIPLDVSIGTGKSDYCEFSSDNQYVAITLNTSPYFAVYKTGENTFIKKANADIAPTARATVVRWSPDGRYLVVIFTAAPYFYIYKFDGNNLTKIANPTILPSSAVIEVCFSSKGDLLILATVSSPFIYAYSTITGSVVSKFYGQSISENNKLGIAITSGNLGEEIDVNIFPALYEN